MKKIIPRAMAPDLIDSAKTFPVVAILGPRQSGKTTLAKELFKKHKYVNFEDSRIRELAEKDPYGFLKDFKNEHGIIIDEFQEVPQFLSTIQVTVDIEKKYGYFILTGSQNFLMNQAISQSLAGRVALHTLLPLSIEELKNAGLLPDELNQLMTQGMYPRIYTDHIVLEKWYESYIQTYLERDVRQLKEIKNLDLFQVFIKLCAGRSGQVLNLTSLGNDCGISDVTAREWINILRASYLIFLLQPYHTNFNKRLIKNPKLYFYDTGLLAHLLGNITSNAMPAHYLKGHIFETFIISDIQKQFYNLGKRPATYFWRDRSKYEIDCIIDMPNRPIGYGMTPVEIKSSRTITSTFFEGLTYWNNLADREKNHSYVIYAGDEEQTRTAGTAIPWKDAGNLLETNTKNQK